MGIPMVGCRQLHLGSSTPCQLQRVRAKVLLLPSGFPSAPENLLWFQGTKAIPLWGHI